MELLSRDSNRNGRTSSNSRHFQQVLDELVDNETELDSQTAEPTNEGKYFSFFLFFFPFIYSLDKIFCMCIFS